jgi:DNA-directed RNA polymerase specialized sigma24 family protein
MVYTCSVKDWLGELKRCDSVTAQKLWERYVKQLVRLARKHLAQLPRRATDEEDVAFAAFDSFWEGVEVGRFSTLDDRGDLWRMLIILTEREAIHEIRRGSAQIPGGGHLRGESAVDPVDGSGSSTLGLERFAGLVAEEFVQLLGALRGLSNEYLAEEVERIAVDKLCGYTNQEISQRLGKSLRCVERRLKLIQRIWSQRGRPV